MSIRHTRGQYLGRGRQSTTGGALKRLHAANRGCYKPYGRSSGRFLANSHVGKWSEPTPVDESMLGVQPLLCPRSHTTRNAAPVFGVSLLLECRIVERQLTEESRLSIAGGFRVVRSPALSGHCAENNDRLARQTVPFSHELEPFGSTKLAEASAAVFP